MKERERRRILDEIADAVHRQSKPEDYAASVDQLVEAGMSLDVIEAEVNDRISRIQTDEEIDNLRSSVKNKGLLIGGVTAVALFLLSLYGSYLLMQSMLPTPEPTPTPTATATPVVIAVQPAGHWLFSIETREVQPAAGDPTQAIITVYIVDKEGNPTPDGLEASFSVTSGNIMPQTSTVHNGVLTALYTAVTGAPPAVLTVNVQNDVATHQMPVLGLGAAAQELTPTATPIRETEPSLTPETPTPTPEPVEITLDWSPKWVSDTIDIGVGQSITLTASVNQNDQPVPNAHLLFTVDSAVATIVLSETSTDIATDENGIVRILLRANDQVGKSVMQAQLPEFSSVSMSLPNVVVWPVAVILKEAQLRKQPDMQDDSKTGETAKVGERYIVEGENGDWRLVRLVDGRKLWVAKTLIDLKPEDSKLPSLEKDAAVVTAPVLSSASDSNISGSEASQRLGPGFYSLDLPDGESGGTGTVEVFAPSSENVLAELPEGVNVEVLQEVDQAAFVPVRVILWVSASNVTDGTPPTLTNSSAPVDVCWYQPGKAPDDEGSKYCGTLKRVTPAIEFARSLTEDEKKNETSFGQDKWKLAVIDVWVKNENLSIGP